MPTISEYLRMLRDVDGVHGSFVIAGTGTLVDSDLPAIFDGELLGEVGPRIARLYETFFSGGGDLDTCMLRFGEHKLYVRRMTWGIIAILSNVGVNLPALRMVVNLVIRRIDPEIAAITSATPTPGRSLPPPLPLTTGPRMASPSWAPSAPTPPSFAPRAMTSTLPSAAPALTIPIDASGPPTTVGDMIIPEDGRDSTVPASDRTLMYRGRPLTS